jgi:hypothetical protein
MRRTNQDMAAFATRQCKQVKNVCLTISNCHNCDGFRHALLCAFQTCQPAFSRLLAVADAGCFARTSQAGAPTSDGLPTLTARPRCLPQVLYATSSHTALDCLGVPALSLTDDEQSPSWWCPGLTAHSRASRRAQLCCEYGHRASLRESHADCPRNGRPPLFLPNACGTLTVGLALRVSTISIRRRFRRLSPKSA